jgi:3',5'-cyclic AMP phosphodiesterase CpdA
MTSISIPAAEKSSRVHRMAHISDLHLGSSHRTERAARALCRTLLEADVDQVLVTGDVTHRGRKSELDQFKDLFEPLIRRGCVMLVPGNHDRMTDDVSCDLMGGPRVQSSAHDGMFLVRLDSSAPHNRSLHRGHGEVSTQEVEMVESALSAAPHRLLRVVMLHHHALPLPVEDLFERVTCWLGLPWCAELKEGSSFVERLRGRCDLILHGHRHVPSSHHVPGDQPLRIFNAGSSTGTRRIRIFRHSEGALVGEPEWLSAVG